MQFLKWLIIAVSAYYGKKTMNFSTATVGATMLVKGIIDLTKAVGFQILSPSDAASILTAITPIRAWVTYGVATLAFLLQRKLIEQVDVPPPTGSEEAPKKKWTQKENTPPCVNLFCGMLLKVCSAVDNFLLRNLETLKDGGKGAMVRQMTRGLSSTTKANKDAKVDLDVTA